MKTQVYEKRYPENGEMPERDNSETLVTRPSIYSKALFAMTDNGITVVYYDFEDEQWKSHERDMWTKVEYWLEPNTKEDGREVEFGKWLSIHCSDKLDDFSAPDGSLYYFESGGHLKTIEELFQLFKTNSK